VREGTGRRSRIVLNVSRLKVSDEPHDGILDSCDRGESRTFTLNVQTRQGHEVLQRGAQLLD